MAEEKIEETMKEYLGDGVTASFDGYQIWLEVGDSYWGIKRIALEPEVMAALLMYSKRVFTEESKE